MRNDLRLMHNKIRHAPKGRYQGGETHGSENCGIWGETCRDTFVRMVNGLDTHPIPKQGARIADSAPEGAYAAGIAPKSEPQTRQGEYSH